MQPFARWQGRMPRALFFGLLYVTIVTAGCYLPRVLNRPASTPPQNGFYVAHSGGSCKESIDAAKFGANAFVVGPNVAMTAAHLVWKEGQKMTVKEVADTKVTLRRGGMCFDATIVVIDQVRDIMVLAAKVPDEPFMITSRTPMLLEIVTVRGFQYVEPSITNYRFLFHSGMVNNITTKRCKDGRTLTKFEAHALKSGEGLFPGGTSGSAFFDAWGKIVGMLTRSDRKTYAVVVGAQSLNETLAASFLCLTAPCLIAASCD